MGEGKEKRSRENSSMKRFFFTVHNDYVSDFFQVSLNNEIYIDLSVME